MILPNPAPQINYLKKLNEFIDHKIEYRSHHSELSLPAKDTSTNIGKYD